MDTAEIFGLDLFPLHNMNVCEIFAGSSTFIRGFALHIPGLNYLAFMFVATLFASYSAGTVPPARANDPSVSSAIEIESEGVYQIGAGDTLQIAKALALYEAKKAAVAAAGKYLSRKGIIEYYERKKEEVYNLVIDGLIVRVLSEQKTGRGGAQRFEVRIAARIDATDFIQAEITNLKLEHQEAKASLRSMLEPSIEPKVRPGRELATAYRLMRKGHLRPALLYLARLKDKYPHWGEAYLAEAIAHYIAHDLPAMHQALKTACAYNNTEACEDLKNLKRMHDQEFDLAR